MVENLYMARVGIRSSDGGGEYTSIAFKDYLSTNGITHEMSCPYTPQQNGIAERKRRHITETGLAMMFHARVPRFLWTEAFHTAVYIINRLPTEVLASSTPY